MTPLNRTGSCGRLELKTMKLAYCEMNKKRAGCSHASTFYSFITEPVLKSLYFHVCELKPLKMFHRFWFCLCLCRLVGVFADTDAVKPVSVMEGDSHYLYTGFTQIVDSGQIRWTFGSKNTLIAQISKRAGSMTVYDNVPDGRFRDRLMVDPQTGSLIIRNIRSEHTGAYQLQTDRMRKLFILYFYGVFADPDSVTSVSVMEGDSVTLNSDLTEVHDDDQIQWVFVTENTLIAHIYVTADSRVTVYDERAYGRFRGRMKVDHQTGSLTITNTRTTDSGLYQLQINRNVSKSFNFTVYDSVLPCDSAEAVIRLVLSALVGVAAAAAVILLVYDIRSRRTEI